MKQELDNLNITNQTLEKLTGFEINNIFVGGVIGGGYRPSIFQKPKRLLSFWITEILVSVLIFVLTLPIGLLFNRNLTNGVNEPSGIWQFLSVTLGITLIAIVSWNLYMWFRVKQLRILMHLLDEVDKYNEVVQAVDILDRLEAVGNSQVNLINRDEVLEALRVTKNTLIAGLMTEKILRESRISLTRRHELFANIENNLATLRTLEVKERASEYGQLLNEALQIGLSVHREVQNFSRFPPRS